MLEKLNDWRLRDKLLVAFSMIGLVIVTLNVTSILSQRAIGNAQRPVFVQSLPAVAALENVAGYLREYDTLVAHYASISDAQEQARLDRRIEAVRNALTAEIETVASKAGPAIKPAVANLKERLGALEEVGSRILDLRRAHRQREALALVNREARQVSDEVLGRRAALAGQVIAQAAADGSQADWVVGTSFYVMLVLAASSLGCLAFVWHSFRRSVADPMAELAAVAKALADGSDLPVPCCARGDEVGEIARAVEMFRQSARDRRENDRKIAANRTTVMTTLGDALSLLAQGDLMTEVGADFPQEAASLKANFNDAVARLRGMIGSVSESAAGIRTGASEIAQAAEDLARRTESNAASLEQTSAALSQIDDRLKGTASAAARTVERADQAIASVGGGRSMADEAVQAMERVSASATGIDSVIEGLDKIAFQTRVLAMNAAVEAGRAGDAGRGFAVVADLVSSLAMRSEEEAKRARDQITVTQTDIVTAVGAVERVDRAFADISEDVGEVHKLLGGMAADNQAQSSAVTQITVAIGVMDQSTQQNAAMVEQTSAAARNLTLEVTSLAEQAALFKVGRSATPAAPAITGLSALHKAVAPTIPIKPGASGYVSLVKPLPHYVAAQANGSSRQANGASADDWSDF